MKTYITAVLLFVSAMCNGQELNLLSVPEPTIDVPALSPKAFTDNQSVGIKVLVVSVAAGAYMAFKFDDEPIMTAGNLISLGGIAIGTSIYFGGEKKRPLPQ